MEEQHTSASRSGPHCHAILRAVPDAVFVCNRRGKILLANPAFAALTGMTEEALGGFSAKGLAPELTRMVLEQNKDVFADGKTRVVELVFSLNGQMRFFSVTKGICRDCSWGGTGVFGIAREMTEMRAVERQIIDTSDREKERLGHELRENFCQHLVGISLLGNVLHEELAKAGLGQARFARQITSLVKEVVREVRNLEKSLSVAHLEHGDSLVGALRDLAELVSVQNKIVCSVQAPVNRLIITPETAMYLFRIAQEAVHSAVRRHSVSRVVIRLAARQSEVVLWVRDNGTGFPEEKTVEEWAPEEFPIMFYRSRVIGAKLEFQRLENGGIELACRVPAITSGGGRIKRTRMAVRTAKGNEVSQEGCKG